MWLFRLNEDKRHSMVVTSAPYLLRNGLLPHGKNQLQGIGEECWVMGVLVPISPSVGCELKLALGLGLVAQWARASSREPEKLRVRFPVTALAWVAG